MSKFRQRWDGVRSSLVVGLDEIRGFLANHDCRGVGIGADDVGHNASVRNANAFEALDLEGWVHDGGGIGEGTHLAGANRVIHGGAGFFDQLDQVFIRLGRVLDRGVNELPFDLACEG